MERKKLPETILDVEMSQRELAANFQVSEYWIAKLRGWGLVPFRRSSRNGFPAWLAIPRDFLDVPLYPLHFVAKFVGRKSARTVRRWWEAGGIELTRRPGSVRLYATPRQLEEIRRYAVGVARRRRPPNPKRLLEKLAALADKTPRPDWEKPTDAWTKGP